MQKSNSKNIDLVLLLQKICTNGAVMSPANNMPDCVNKTVAIVQNVPNTTLSFAIALATDAPLDVTAISTTTCAYAQAALLALRKGNTPKVIGLLMVSHNKSRLCAAYVCIIHSDFCFHSFMSSACAGKPIVHCYHR